MTAGHISCLRPPTKLQTSKVGFLFLLYLFLLLGSISESPKQTIPIIFFAGYFINWKQNLEESCKTVSRISNTVSPSFNMVFCAVQSWSHSAKHWFEMLLVIDVVLFLNQCRIRESVLVSGLYPYIHTVVMIQVLYYYSHHSLFFQTWEMKVNDTTSGIERSDTYFVKRYIKQITGIQNTV